MRKTLVFLITAVLFCAEISAQEKDQREMLEELMKKRKADREAFDKKARIYNEKKPELPPARKETGRIERFGLAMFADPPDEFIQSTEIPVPDDYILGPGDNLIVNLWGNVDLSFELTVDREGKVFVPRCGELVLWGRTVSEAEEKIRTFLSTIYTDFSMNLVLGKIRSITVYVSGEVTRPGAYTVNSLYTLFNTLYLAGGPTGKGTLRGVRLIRNGKVVKEIDLYELLMHGKEVDARLESNDIIFVPVTGAVCSITGQVRRPASYELRGEERLADLIALAGGLKRSAYLESIELQRYRQNSRAVINLDISTPERFEENNLPLKDQDLIKVKKVHQLAEEVVFITGEVKYPGRYGHCDSMTVSSLIDESGLLPKSYTERVFLKRSYRDGSREILSMNYDSVLSANLPPVNAELFNPETPGMLNRDLYLEPMDSLFVFSIDEMREPRFLSIRGEVLKPGKFDYVDGITLSDLVSLAGGITRKAYMLECEVARLKPDSGEVSEVVRIDLHRALRNPHGRYDLPLQSEDIVIIRRKPGEQNHRTVIIEGEVMFPGTYVLREDREQLSGLIARAGGLTGDAFPKGALFTRRKIIHEMSSRDVPGIISSIQKSFADTSNSALAAELQFEYNPEKMARIIIDLPALLAEPGGIDDVILKDGDRVSIPSRPAGINVLGAVASSGTIRYREGRKAEYYIERAGGYIRNAVEDEVRIIRADGSVVREDVFSTEMALGDVIIVPAKLKRDYDWLDFLQKSMSILAGALTSVYVVTKL
jgi:protein involved in polysaccharide export with SLBB domain